LALTRGSCGKDCIISDSKLVNFVWVGQNNYYTVLIYNAISLGPQWFANPL
jgi:hypothetical protein